MLLPEFLPAGRILMFPSCREGYRNPIRHRERGHAMSIRRPAIKNAGMKLLAVSIVLCGCVALSIGRGARAQDASHGKQDAPQYKWDPTWPKMPLPNKWTFGGVTGLAVHDFGNGDEILGFRSPERRRHN